MVCRGYVVSLVGFRWQLYYRRTLTSIEDFVERSVKKKMTTLLFVPQDIASLA